MTTREEGVPVQDKATATLFSEPHGEPRGGSTFR